MHRSDHSHTHTYIEVALDTQGWTIRSADHYDLRQTARAEQRM
jgi:hypothetical protein